MDFAGEFPRTIFQTKWAYPPHQNKVPLRRAMDVLPMHTGGYIAKDKPIPIDNMDYISNELSSRYDALVDLLIHHTAKILPHKKGQA